MASSNYSVLQNRGIDHMVFVTMSKQRPVYSDIFHMTMTKNRYLQYQQWKGFYLPQPRQPGGNILDGSFGQSFGINMQVRNWGMGFSIPYEDVEDDPYGVLNRVIPSQSSMYARAFMDLMEQDTSNFFILYGYVSGSQVTGMIDGKSLFNTAHLCNADPGSPTFANRPTTDVDFSTAAFQAACINVENQKYPNNLSFMNNKLRIIVHNPAIDFVVDQVLNSKMEPYTADRNENTMVRRKNVRGVSWNWFGKSGATGLNNAWFGVGEEHGLVFIMRQSMKTKNQPDIKTNSVDYRSTIRFTEGEYYGGRGMYGSPGQ